MRKDLRLKAEAAAAKEWGETIAHRQKLEKFLANPDAHLVKEQLREDGYAPTVVPKTIIWARELAEAITAEETARSRFDALRKE